ncbi:tannase/feruloyl esterase family alpha/beta hydrolase [Actinoallomurus sp. CA-150999]|uniref:tannase/feruloyl esterase family alpha/beta hydrolase n=1 Tax=Actinoallomurus sp. CA-150999 TaxID=3239887 RepID=UPI003D9466FE
MTRRGIRRAVAILAAVALTAPPAQAGATPRVGATRTACAGVRHLPGARITATEQVAAGSYTTPDGQTFTGLPAFCRVAAVTARTVRFEVWIPSGAWSGAYEAVGNGGFAGTITYAAMAQALRAGYATASTDTGHSASDTVGTWISDPVLLADWGHRSIHLMTEPAKAAIAAYRGRRPHHSYFVGGSTGGDQAMEEAEYFPRDYDGIVAMAPGMAYSHLMMSFVHTALPSERDPDAYLPPDRLALLNHAVLSACAADKAVPSDDYLTRPQDCHFDPTTLLCPEGGGASSCLTAPQVAAAKVIYAPVRDARTGRELYPGFVRGSEADPESGAASSAGWYSVQSSGGHSLVRQYAQPLFGRAVFGDPNWDWTGFDFGHDADAVEARLSPVIDATSPDLRAFAAHGGKLIMTQGWSDAYNAQTLPIEYYDKVVRRLGGPARTRSFFRLFMQPGVGHVAGGPGLDGYDAIGTVRAWVERGTAPDSITASKASSGQTRPLCPYPQAAAYSGDGDTRVASSFHCSPEGRSAP